MNSTESDLLIELVEDMAEVKTLLRTMAPQEDRITSLERWRAYLVGGWTVLVAGLAGLWKLVV